MVSEAEFWGGCKHIASMGRISERVPTPKIRYRKGTYATPPTHFMGASFRRTLLGHLFEENDRDWRRKGKQRAK